MREIKFRAWDGKEMTQNGVHVSLHGYAWHWVDGQSLHGSEVNNYPLMQYTGLKDKNGKEIYEGDILNCVAEVEYASNSKITDVIFSHDLQWHARERLNPGIEYTHGLPLTWGGWVSLEVIGNIYENPELLNSVQNVQASVATESDSSNEAEKQNQTP